MKKTEQEIKDYFKKSFTSIVIKKDLKADLKQEMRNNGCLTYSEIITYLINKNRNK